MLPYIVAPLLLALSSAVSVSAITVSSPAINQCQDVTFQIGDAQGQVYLSVLPSVDPCQNEPLVELGPFTVPANGEYTWNNANVAAGTSVVVVVDDASNAEAWSATITVGGSASDCAATSGSADAADPTSHTATPTTTATHNTNTVAPANAAQASDNTGSASSVKASWSVGLLTLLVGATFFA